MPDYYNGIDREREKERILMDKVYAWWDSLSDEEQHNLMQDYYPNEFTEDDVADDFFGDMSNDNQLWIWKRETDPTAELTKEEKDDIVGDMEAHRKMVEGNNDV